MIAQRTPLELDKRAFNNLNRLLARTHEQAPAIAAESAERQGEKSDQVARPRSPSRTSSAPPPDRGLPRRVAQRDDRVAHDFDAALNAWGRSTGDSRRGGEVEWAATPDRSLPVMSGDGGRARWRVGSSPRVPRSSTTVVSAGTSSAGVLVDTWRVSVLTWARGED